MSDLAATNCGCGCEGGLRSNGGSCNCIIWLLILSCICGGNTGFGFGGDCGNGCGGNSCWILILLLLFCGNGFGGDCGCGNNSGCGC